MADEPLEESAAARMRRPDPDPTVATIGFVNDKFNAFKEFVISKFEASEKASAAFREDLVRVPTTLDKALSEVKEYNAAQFSRISEHTDANYNLNIERHKALSETISVFKQTVNERFQLGDIQTEKAARDVKSAVDAAFAAAKEAVGEQNKSNALSITKSETAFTKQIDQLADSVKSIVKNTDDKIDDIKERLLAIEGKTSVSDPATARALQEMAAAISKLTIGANVNDGMTRQSDNGRNTFFAAAAILVSLLIGFGSILAAIFAHHG